jgi:endonuclease/exonuclease/phosphatase family metal-dependent hydrolase
MGNRMFHPKYCLTILLFLPLLGAAWPFAQPTAGNSDGVPLRVLSYNIHHGAGNDRCENTAEDRGGADCGLDLARISMLVRKHRVDVIAFQEVDRFWKRSGGVDQEAELSQLLGMESCYGANLELPSEVPGQKSRQYGTLILSRFPIVECKNTHLPQAAADSEQRGLLVAEVLVRGRNVRIANTHLHVRHEDRVLQTPKIVEILASDTVIPTVLMGDMNAKPEEQSMGPLLSMWKDAWELAGKGKGYTSPANPTRPARNRIDYILVSDGIAVESVEVDASAEARMASDHYPVSAVLRIPGAL